MLPKAGISGLLKVFIDGTKSAKSVALVCTLPLLKSIMVLSISGNPTIAKFPLMLVLLLFANNCLTLKLATVPSKSPDKSIALFIFFKDDSK